MYSAPLLLTIKNRQPRKFRCADFHFLICLRTCLIKRISCTLRRWPASLFPAILFLFVLCGHLVIFAVSRERNKFDRVHADDNKHIFGCLLRKTGESISTLGDFENKHFDKVHINARCFFSFSELFEYVKRSNYYSSLKIY